MSTQANLGQKALDIRDYPEAIRQYTAALSTNLDNPSPLWLIQRATAYQRSSKFDLALLDAEAALLAARRRSRREFIATAQFRRAVALHGLKRYGDARLCLVWCRAANEKEKALGIWQEKVTNDYAKAENEFGKDSEQCRTTVKEIPDKVEIVGVKEVEEKVNSAPKSAPAATSATPKEKIRHDWLQSGSKVIITIYAKGVPKDKATVDIQADSLDISFPVGSGSEYSLDFEPLFASVDPTQSTFSISPYKIEISLHKATPNQKWSALEGDAKVASKVDPSPAVQPQVVETNKTPSYPTSSRNGPKNWDAVATSSLENEGEEEASVDSFFQKLYKDADPDTRKAMLKSYQESNGTALSMNWNDVKKGPVPTSPPDGVEAKPW